MQQKGYDDISLKELINKVKKLKQKYKSEKDKSKRSGNAGSAGKKWKHFEKMDCILSNKHNINPPFLVDMMAESSNLDPGNVWILNLTITYFLVREGGYRQM